MIGYEMNNFSHKKASELIAKLFKLKSSKVHVAIEKYIGDELASVKYTQWFITQDSGAMAELAWENGISIEPQNFNKFVTVSADWLVLNNITEYYAAHNNDHLEATRVAIAKELIKLKGGELKDE